MVMAFLKNGPQDIGVLSDPAALVTNAHQGLAASVNGVPRSGIEIDTLDLETIYNTIAETPYVVLRIGSYRITPTPCQTCYDSPRP